MQEIFETEALSVGELLQSVAYSVIVLVVVEVWKYFRRARK
jgi:hypothetical protein